MENTVLWDEYLLLPEEQKAALHAIAEVVLYLQSGQTFHLGHLERVLEVYRGPLAGTVRGKKILNTSLEMKVLGEARKAANKLLRGVG